MKLEAKLMLLTLLLIGYAIADSVNACDKQAECLKVTRAETCVNGLYREVCVEWVKSFNCIKKNANATIGFVCFDGQGKTSHWVSDTKICTRIFSGRVTRLAVSDGGDCSKTGFYNLTSIQNVTCRNDVYPDCADEDNNNDNKFCTWEIPTPECENYTPPLP